MSKSPGTKRRTESGAAKPKSSQSPDHSGTTAGEDSKPTEAADSHAEFKSAPARLRWVLLVGALLPAAASLMMTASPGKLAPLELAGGTRGLLFETYLYHFGMDPIDPQGMLMPEFRFANISDRQITLTKMEPSCGCLAPRWTRQKVAPGDRGAIIVPIRTSGEAAGPHEYLVQLSYLDGDDFEKQLTLTVKVILPESQIRVEPKALMVYSNANVPTKHKVVVTDYRGSRVQITGMESSSSWVTAARTVDDRDSGVQTATLPERSSESDATGDERIRQVGHTSVSGDGLHRATIEVTIPAGVPPGRHNAVLRIHTTDQEFETLTVPVLIMGPQSPERAVVTVTPPAMRMQVATEGPDATAELAMMVAQRVTVEVPESWSISHADCDPEACRVTYDVVVSDKPSMQQIDVVITQREAIASSLKTGVVSLHFDEQGQLVTIPLTFAHAIEASPAGP